MRWVVLGCVWGLATGCLGGPRALPACDAWANQGAVCGFMNPEDLAPLPLPGWILVSEMTTPGPRPEGAAFVSGRLSALRVSRDGTPPERRVLFPVEWDEAPPRDTRWGDPDCPGPPTGRDFEPHGVDVGVGPGGLPAVAVVTHGAREGVDLFALEIAEGVPALAWRGCVAMPEARSANDVALLAEGAFVVTDMTRRIEGTGPAAIWTLLRVGFGAQTGRVLRWAPGEGLEEVPGSQGSAPNGIAASADGRSIYFAEWGGERVRRLRFGAPGAAPERVEAPIQGSPDNLTWTPDGRLLVAAQQGGPLQALRCMSLGPAGCDLGYSVSILDPETMQAEVILTGRGAASVALDRGDEFLIGVFSGDSIERRRPGE